MQHNIRRNKKVFDYLQEQLKRLNWKIPVSMVFPEFIFENLSTADSKEIVNKLIDESILDNDSVFIETVKFIGLLEIAKSEDEVKLLLERRKEIKYGGPLTDFDKILKAIITVPNQKEEK